MEKKISLVSGGWACLPGTIDKRVAGITQVIFSRACSFDTEIKRERVLPFPAILIAFIVLIVSMGMRELGDSLRF